MIHDVGVAQLHTINNLTRATPSLSLPPDGRRGGHGCASPCQTRMQFYPALKSA